jgi:integrase
LRGTFALNFFPSYFLQHNLHDLRHSAATLLIIVMKMPANLVQELLGHDDIETTLGLYTHPDPEMQRPMMEGLDDLFGTDV